MKSLSHVGLLHRAAGPVLAARDKNRWLDVKRRVLLLLYIACLTQFHPVSVPHLGLLRAPWDSGCEVAADPHRDPLGGMSVPVGMPGGGHGAIGNFVREQPRGALDDGRGVRASQDRSAGGHASGRSVVSRITRTGLPSEGASSWTPLEASAG
jgi:hypothetical protein